MSRIVLDVEGRACAAAHGRRAVEAALFFISVGLDFRAIALNYKINKNFVYY